MIRLISKLWFLWLLSTVNALAASGAGQPSVEQLVMRLLSPIEGKVVSIRGEEITISIGTQEGAIKGDEVEIRHFGKKRTIARAMIQQARLDESLAKVLAALDSPRKQDIARLIRNPLKRIKIGSILRKDQEISRRCRLLGLSEILANLDISVISAISDATEKADAVIDGDIEVKGNRTEIDLRLQKSPGQQLLRAIRSEISDSLLECDLVMIEGVSDSIPGALSVELNGCIGRRCSNKGPRFVIDTLPVFSSAGGDIPAFYVFPGAKVQVLSGMVVTNKPGKARLIRNIRIGGQVVKAGEVLDFLTFDQQGYSSILFKGAAYSGIFGNDAKLIQSEEADWWVEIRNADGEEGWVNDPSKLSETCTGNCKRHDLYSEKVPIQHAGIDINDQAALQRGAKWFMNFCAGCHSLKYVQYRRMGREIGLTDELTAKNLKFVSSAKLDDSIETAMRAEDAMAWFGAAVPDLTLITRIRPGGPDWVYTFLKSFYRDVGQPFGVDNALLPNVRMPDVLWKLRGTQRALYKRIATPGGSIVNSLDHFEQMTPGQMSAQEFDGLVRDLTAFLAKQAAFVPDQDVFLQKKVSEDTFMHSQEKHKIREGRHQAPPIAPGKTQSGHGLSDGKDISSKMSRDGSSDLSGSWISTNDFTTLIEFFSDGTGALGTARQFINWSILPDKRLRIVAQSQLDKSVLLGDVSAIEQGYVTVNDQEYIPFDVNQKLLYEYLGEAMRQTQAAQQNIAEALKDIKTKKELGGQQKLFNPFAQFVVEPRLTSEIEKVREALNKCNNASRHAIQEYRGFARGYIVRAQCLEQGIYWKQKLGDAKINVDVEKRTKELLKLYAHSINIGLPISWKGRVLNSLAWLHATSLFSVFRNGELAVDYARKAVDLFPDKHTYLDTLAAAYAQNNQFSEAVDVQNRAMAMLGPNDDSLRSEYQNRLRLYLGNTAYVDN